jgi:lantibiotic biosynthesis protein
MKWQPIIDVSKRNDFLVKLSEISDTLLNNLLDFKNNNGIVSDRIGTALFLFYYARFTQEEKYADTAYNLISKVFDELNAELEEGEFGKNPNGFPWLGWALGLSEKEGFLDINTREMLEELDELLNQLMIETIKHKNFDYINGALNKAIYFLNRANDPNVRSFLENLVDTIDAACDRDPNGGLKFSFISLDENENPISDCDLGLAHGMPSVTWFLSRIIEQNIARGKTSVLLEGFTSFILRQKQDTTKYISNFPRYAYSYYAPINSRLAWCYGDLGIAASLWQTAKISGNKKWETEAIRVLQHSSKRRDLEENQVIDAGLCHGASGIAHIFNRMYNNTGLEEFKHASVYWLDETLKMAKFPDGYAGYKCWKGEEAGWQNAADLFGGITGVGLAIISGISGIEPNWDRALLLS